ncbi:hypothetical protein [Nonomuraea wenchangensis]|uniref:hypothetical protein n=1 Tax=Nonomuraea wenchangensis TaxID=568860 RepID=UPI0033C43CC6
MQQRTPGADVCVGAVGLGRAGMSGAYGHRADELAIGITAYGVLALLDSERTGGTY